jgi:hypothetical protein
VLWQSLKFFFTLLFQWVLRSSTGNNNLLFLTSLIACFASESALSLRSYTFPDSRLHCYLVIWGWSVQICYQLCVICVLYSQCRQCHPLAASNPSNHPFWIKVRNDGGVIVYLIISVWSVCIILHRPVSTFIDCRYSDFVCIHKCVFVYWWKLSVKITDKCRKHLSYYWSSRWVV